MKKTTFALFTIVSMVAILLCGCGVEVVPYDVNDGGNAIVTQVTADSQKDTIVTIQTSAVVQDETIIVTSETRSVAEETITEVVETEQSERTGYIAQVEPTEVHSQETTSKQPEVYQVKYGDTLSAIAAKCKDCNGNSISIEYLLQFNHWTDDIMYEGDVLYIPSEYTMQNPTEYNPRMIFEEVTPQYVEVYGEHSNTSYTADWNSFENMIAACNVLNGMTIPAKSTFSWLSNVEPYASPNYVMADCYYGGTVIQDYGGGICMVSSTLKVAAYNAGLSIINSYPHTMPVSYVNRQTEDWQFLEAAVDSGSGMDLVIYNPLDRAVTITAWVEYPSVTVIIQ